jgi:hypothetical protein
VLDDALDDSLEQASEDQRPCSAQPQHAQRHTGSSPQYSPEGAHGATSGADARHEGQPWPEFVNRDTRHQGGAPGHEPVAAASTRARQCRRTDMGMQNSHPRDHPDTPASPAICDSNEKLARPPQRAPPADRSQPQALARPGEDRASPAGEAVPDAQGHRRDRPRKTG